MPTGYTMELAEKGMEFNKFVLQCARAFGACIMMRDDPMDAEIPEKFEPSDYHTKELAQAKVSQEKLSVMTKEEKIKFGQEKKKDAINSCSKQITRYKAENSRLLKMESQVKAWRPPADIINLKNFILDQIKISLHDLTYYCEEIKVVEGKTPIDFYDDTVASVIWDIIYHTEEDVKECNRAKERTVWIQQLRASLKD